MNFDNRIRDLAASNRILFYTEGGISMDANNIDTCKKLIIDEINLLQNQIASLKKEIKEGIITDVGATYLEELTNRRFKLIEKRVLDVHTNAIQEGTITKNGKEKTYYQSRVKGMKTPPRSYSYEGLIEKLYEIYFCGEVLKDYSFKSVYEIAKKAWIGQTGPKEKTVRDRDNSYNVFITEEFGQRDIRTITGSDLKIYMMETVMRLRPKAKRFKKFKTVLYMVFEYASDSEHQIIPVNIVPKDNTPYLKQCENTVVRPEDKAFSPDDIFILREYLWKRVNTLKYDLNGYAILFASHTGVRQAEIPALKWSDISDTMIHIHAQQNDERVNGVKTYYYNPTTKDEKGISHDGRKFPITSDIRKILTELKAKQEALGIESEWVFAREDGSWTTTAAYYEALYKVCHDKLHLGLTNNHALRIALNSYVFVPMGLNVAERARLLGHSPAVNLKHYTFAREESYIVSIGEMIDKFNEKQVVNM